MEIEVTEKERDLIETLRNMKRSYPNGQTNGWFYIQDIVAELIDPECES